MLDADNRVISQARKPRCLTDSLALNFFERHREARRGRRIHRARTQPALLSPAMNDGLRSAGAIHEQNAHPRNRTDFVTGHAHRGRRTQ